MPKQHQILSKIYRDDTRSETKLNWWKGLQKYISEPARSERLLTASVIFLVIIALPVIWVQLSQNIKGPFAINPEENHIALQQAEANQDPDLLGLKSRDTDRDELSDYDELNIYSTSPYLADSDSDGIDDRREIEVGSDPNCPRGETCFRSDVNQNAAPSGSPNTLTGALSQLGGSELGDLLSQLGGQDILGQEQTESQGTDEAKDVNNQIRNFSNDELRQLLLQAGVASDLVSQISDQALRELANEAFAEL